jgi:LDH2 family malate/lactate/ureidoglycolate dehydrogenase
VGLSGANVLTYRLTGDVPVARFPEPRLRTFVEDFLARLGFDSDEARITADGLMMASGWWHPGQGQGLEKLIRYARRVDNGGIVTGAPTVTVRDHASSALIDAGKGLGYVAAHRAMAMAVEKARGRGIALVGVRNSNHFGIAGYHAAQAARNGMIGIAQTNAGAEMAPWGSATPVLGTNPWGLAVPRGSGHDPIVLDMALTQSGKGMMRWLAAAGLPMPEHWALTPSGERTSDPAAADKGPLLPIGDYKGYGLSLITDVLCGVMTGALFGTRVFQDDTHFDVGHVMIAIDPDCFMDRPTFDGRLESLVDEVRSAPPLDPKNPVLLPGEAEQARSRQRFREGIPVSLATVDQVSNLARAMSLRFPEALPDKPTQPSERASPDDT